MSKYFISNTGPKFTLFYDGSIYTFDLSAEDTERAEKFSELIRQFTVDNNIAPVYEFLSAKETKVKTEVEELTKNLDELVKTADGFAFTEYPTLTLPHTLLEEWRDASPERKDALKNFWGWCILLPTDTRRDLFPFIRRNNLTITPTGQFIGYRCVKDTNKDKTVSKKLVTLVSQAYVDIKSKKKNPAKTSVYLLSDGEYLLYEHRRKTQPELAYEDLGTVQELYENLSVTDVHSFTDNYTQTMKIDIGAPVLLARDKCDSDPNIQCGKGLHVTTWEALPGWYGSMGQTKIAVLVNPMDVVAVPEKYKGTKLRCCRYLPIAIVNDKPLHEDLEDRLIELDNEHLVGTVDELHDILNRLNFDSLANELDEEEKMNPINLMNEEVLANVRNELKVPVVSYGKYSFDDSYDYDDDYADEEWDDDDDLY